MFDASSCRLLRHPPAAGAWNMAVDEMLLDRAAQQSAPCLRIYAWNEPTLSLGYFQTYDDRREHAASRHCTAVRRQTGGGAIVHDQEITYSMALPSRHALAARRDELYRVMHGCLIDAFADFGVTARLCDGVAKSNAVREPFLCFQRRAVGDVLLGDHKICGSAQRRRSGAVLQHGSLLWRASTAAPELPGLADLAARPATATTLLEAWLDRLSRRLALRWQDSQEFLVETEVLAAQALAEHRYGREVWTIYRGRCPTAGDATLADASSGREN